jgi:hypothetical protein
LELSPDDAGLELRRDAPSRLDRPAKPGRIVHYEDEASNLWRAPITDDPSQLIPLHLSTSPPVATTAMADDETRRETSRLWRVWKTTKQLCYDRVRPPFNSEKDHQH